METLPQAKFSASRQSAQDFIQSIFSPMVTVLASDDAEAVCQKNGLSFVELVRPFSQLSSEAHIRDPVNPTVVIPIRNLKINMVDLSSPGPPAPLVHRVLNEVVTKTLFSVDLSAVSPVEKQMQGNTPWYEAFKDCFFQLLRPMDHEFTRHVLACVIVVSSHHPDPMSAFSSLGTKQTNLQQSSDRSNPYIKWFSSNTFKYYVLVHDVSDGEDTKADAVFQSMKSVYGSHVCFHLQINSRPKLLPNAPENIQMPDPWSQYLYPFGDEALDLDDEVDNTLIGGEKSKQPTQAELEKTEEKIISELERAEQMAQASLNSPLRFQDPLTSMHYNETLEDDDPFNDLGPLKPGPPDIVKDIADTYSKSNNSEKEVRVNEYRKSLKQFSFYSVAKLGNWVVNRQKGQCLTVTDHDRIKAFVYEFAIRGLLPHIEKLMRTISEQILSRKGIHRSIVNVTKKWFGSNRSAGGSLGAGLGSGVSYPSDAPELQQRKLGDLAFLVQHYELAFNAYHTAKRDFNNEHAWMYFAGALEMAAISAFMQGPQRSYPVHYFEACISTYLNTCRMAEYATRACLMSTEALKARGMYADAAFEYIKLTNEDSDLRSALLLEQAAYCYLHNKPPMFRKYAFHMILAGHRYSKAVQRKHTLRCYVNALQIYKDRNWTLAEDHVNFIIGRQCFNLGQLDNATNALQQLLVYESQQQPIQQASHLREFLTVFKQNAEQQEKMMGSADKTSLPELPLPSIDASATRVLLSYSTSAASQVVCGSPFTNDPNRSRTIIAGQYSFKRNYGKAYVQRWSELEKKTVQVVTRDVPYPWKPHIPCLSSAVRNAEMPNCVAGETIAVEVLFINPLRLPLNLLNLHLLWEFTAEDKESVVLTNELKAHDETVITEFISNVTLKNHEKKPVSLSLVPQKPGNLKVTGLIYTLSSVGVTGAVDEEGKVELIQQTDNGLAAVGVEGLQRLVVLGPRLNGTKKEKTSVMYGKDSRLDIRVLPPLPLLEVSMIDFPISLLCGEIRQTSFKFVNQGERPLKNLYLACSKKDCFSVRAPPDNACDFGTESEIYETLSNCSIHVSEVEDSAIATPQDVTRIPLPAGKLLSGAGFHLPIWIHGINTPGVHELDFLFYYEPVEPHDKMRYRIIHQTVRIQTLSTLSVSVRARRCDVNRTKSFSVEHEENQPETESYLVSVDIENKAQGLTFPRCVEFSVSQITCFAKNWKLGCVSQLPSGMPSLKPGESLTLHFRTTAVRPSFDTYNTLVSQISFGNALIDGSKAPAIDFFIRSGMNASLLKKTNASIEGTGFILFWQTSFIDDSCVRHTVHGQTYASVSKVETNQGDLSWSTLKNITKVDGPRSRWSLSPVAKDIACPVDIYLFHPSCVSHDFQKVRCCVIRIEVHLKNVDTKTVRVAVDVKSNSCQSPSPTLSSGSPPIVELVSTSPDLVVEASPTTVPCWVGRTRIQLALKPQEERMVYLHALVSHPGTYDLNSITFREIHDNTELDYRPLTTINAPSVVCVTGN